MTSPIPVLSERAQFVRVALALAVGLVMVAMNLDEVALGLWLPAFLY